MSRRLVEKLKEGIVVFDIDGVLAAYEFGKDCHYAPVWEEAFVSETDNPYHDIHPLPVLQRFVAGMNSENVYVCSVAAPFERKAKAAFVLKNYEIREDHLFFVDSKSDKIGILRKIRENSALSQIAIVDDTVKTLDQIFEEDSFLTIHISSFFDF